MPAAVAAATPAGESSTTMQSDGVTPHLAGDVEKQIRRRLAARHVARREQIGLEEPHEVRWFPGSRGRGRAVEDEATHFGPRSQVSAYSTWRGRAHFGAQALQGRWP